MSTLSTNAFYANALAGMNALQTQANTLQAQIATGNRIQQSSQDPAGAAELRSLQQQDALAAVDSANSNTARTGLNLADNALTSIVTIVQNIQTLTTQAASSTVSDSQRATIGTQIAAYQQNLVSLANSTDSAGHALFGGETGGPAYSLDASGNATYVGTANAAQLSLGPGLSVTTGVTGPQVFGFTSNGVSSDLLTLVKSLATALGSGSGSQGAAQAALGQLSDGLAAVTTAQTVVGARLSWIDTTATLSTRIGTQRQTEEADIGSTDITTAVTRLQQVTTALQASQASFVKLAGLSLFNLIQ
ncbi:MAG: flagellar biosynthesis protein FlgL [Sphingomonadales bacterium]|nr:flagellar biosynthesis protein FlgL [Sphingomonadales bacterium]